MEKGKQKDDSEERAGQIECKVMEFIIVEKQDRGGKSLFLLCLLSLGLIWFDVEYCVS